MISKLGWKKIKFLGHNPDEMLEGYVFTVDGKNLEFDSFQPLGWYDIDFYGLEHKTETENECPPVACCSCGCIYCDSVRALVEPGLKPRTMSWTIFHFNTCGDADTARKNNLGKYTFSDKQYLQAIKSLEKAVEEEHHG